MRISNVEKAAGLCFSRKERFIEGYSIRNELIRLCNMFFGNRTQIEQTGLRSRFYAMKEYVREENLIGLIICGLNLRDIYINEYMQQIFKIVKLTVASITRTLMYEYFNRTEILELCKKTPGYDLYYKSLDSVMPS